MAEQLDTVLFCVDQTHTITAMDNQPEPNEPWLVLLPLLIVLSTFLFLLLLFLLCILLLRRRRSIILRDSDGPIDMSREDLIHGEGGFEGVESRWLESVSENARRDYLRARGTCDRAGIASLLTLLFPQITSYNTLQTPFQQT